MRTTFCSWKIVTDDDEPGSRVVFSVAIANASDVTDINTTHLGVALEALGGVPSCEVCSIARSIVASTSYRCVMTLHAPLRAAVTLRARLPSRGGCTKVSPAVRSRSRRPGAVSVKIGLRQWREVERDASWPRRQPRQVRSAQCVLCGRAAGSPRGDARSRRAPRN